MGPETTHAQGAGTRNRLTVPGGQLAYEIAGKGTPIVFIHAAIADRRMWNREFDAYSRDHTVVRYDRRGFGESPPATAPYSEIEDLRAVLDHLRLGASILVGCSNGGGLALDLAVEHPSAVKELLLVATGVSGFDGSTDPQGQPDYDADGVRLKEVFKAWTAGRKEVALQGLREYWCSMQTGPELELVRRMMRENADEIFTDASAQHNRGLEAPALPRLKSIRVPTTVLYGDHDEPTGGWIARRVAREIPGAEFVPVSGADHLVNLSRPDAFDAALKRLLR